MALLWGLRYGTEKSTLRLAKLTARFTEPLAFEPAELDAFDLRGTTPSGEELAARQAGKRAAPLEVVSVRCFACSKVSGARAELLAQVKATMRLEELTHLNEARASARKGGPPSPSPNHHLGGGGGAAASLLQGGLQGGLRGGGSLEGGGMGAAAATHPPAAPPDAGRKARRAARTAALFALAAAKPGPDDDDPADVAAIAEAERTLGDFTRKVAAATTRH